MMTPRKSLTVASFLALMAYSLFIALPSSPLLTGAGYDREVFNYVAMVIGQGGSPYLDVFDHKPPLIYLIAAFGQFFGIWGFWLLERLVTGLAAFIFYMWLKKNKFRASLFLSFLLITLLNLPAIYEGGGLTRNFSACFNLIFFCVIGSSLNTRKKYIVGGFLTGATLMLQQNEILPMCGWVVAWVLLKEDKSKTNLLNVLGLYILGISSVVFPVLLFLWFNGAIPEFVNQAVIFNFQYISTSDPLFTRLAKFLASYSDVGLLLPSLFLFCIKAVSFIQRRRKNFQAHPFLVPGLAASLGQLLAIALSDKFFPHYFLGLIPILLIFLGIALQEAYTVRRFLLPIAAAIFIFLSLPVGPFVSSLFQSLEGVAHITQRAEYVKINDDFEPYLRPLAGQPGQFFVFRNTPQTHINTYFKIISPSKFIYTHFYDEMPLWDKDGTLFKSIITDLQTAKTRYILDYSGTDPIIRNDLQKEWDAFLISSYSQIKVLPDGGVLMELIK